MVNDGVQMHCPPDDQRHHDLVLGLAQNQVDDEYHDRRVGATRGEGNGPCQGGGE